MRKIGRERLNIMPEISQQVSKGASIRSSIISFLKPFLTMRIYSQSSYPVLHCSSFSECQNPLKGLLKHRLLKL